MRIKIHYLCFSNTVGCIFGVNLYRLLHYGTDYLANHPKLEEIGLKIIDDGNVVEYTFDVIDERKFFLSVIKYGIEFTEV